jgi:two-component system CheB/CheR fusion protein
VSLKSEVLELRFAREGAPRRGNHRLLVVYALPLASVSQGAGHVFGCVLVFRDVTGRRATDLALTESEERLRLALRAAELGSWVWNVAEDRVRADDRLAFLYGLDSAELAHGVPIERLFQRVDTRDVDRVRVDVGEAFDKGGTFDSAYRIRGRDDVERWLRAHGRVELDAEGKPFRMSGTVLDTTESRRLERERQEAEESLKDADRRKDEPSRHWRTSCATRLRRSATACRS